MAYIETTSEDQAQGLLHEIYDKERQSSGHVPNHMIVFSHRPEVLDAWRKLIATVRGNLRLRQYELVTFAAARKLRCDY